MKIEKYEKDLEEEINDGIHYLESDEIDVDISQLESGHISVVVSIDGSVLFSEYVDLIDKIVGTRYQYFTANYEGKLQLSYSLGHTEFFINRNRRARE